MTDAIRIGQSGRAAVLAWRLARQGSLSARPPGPARGRRAHLCRRTSWRVGRCAGTSARFQLAAFRGDRLRGRSGSAGRLIAALGDAVTPVSVEGFAGWMLRDESPCSPREHKARVYRPQGWLSPVLLVDGRIAGVWRHERKRGRVSVAIEPFEPLGDAVRAGAEREAQRLAGHLGGELELAWSG